MKLTGRISALAMAIWLTVSLTLPAWAAAPGQEYTILFTHDLHSHLMPALDEEGQEYGGYARLMTVIQEQRERHPNALLLDGGDFSMGSLFQTAYATSATELRVMGAMGYDTATFGNHEYDYRASGLASMLNAAVDSGDSLPALVEANYLPPREGEEGYGAEAQAVWDAFENYGVSDYTIIQRDGLFLIFGINGEDSSGSAPMSGMILHDRFETAQRVIDQGVARCLEEYGREPVVICLSHSGLDGKGTGEDYELARRVKGIDLIVSGHTHTTLTKPLQVGETYIVSCGAYGKNLGMVCLAERGDGMELSDYRLIPIHDGIDDNPEVAAMVDRFKNTVEHDYLSRFDMTFDQVLTQNPYTFDSVGQVYATAHESTLGNLLSDAYLWAAEQAVGEPVDVALTASGVIRESIPRGRVTVSDVFNVASLGIGADGVPGYPLVSVYLTGTDLRNALEVDASVYPIMNAAQLFCSGVEYALNPNRMIFNRVTDAAIRRADGSLEPIEKDRLYRVVTGLYCGQMLGEVKQRAFGMLSIVPRDEAGRPIDMERLEDYIVRDAQGDEVKEWHAIARYLQSMGEQVREHYGQPDGRKVVRSSLNPIELLRNPNKFTVAAVAGIVVIITVAVLLVWLAVRRFRGGKTGGEAKGYRDDREGKRE